jgi:hypothetical protein
VEMGIYQIRLYDLFRRELHLPDEKAAAFVVTIEDTIRSENEKINQPLITKTDSLYEDIFTIKADIKDLKKDMADLRIDMSNFKAEMNEWKAEMNHWKAEMYQSIYRMGIVQFIAIVGSVMAIVKFMK